jgi:hypothetical protein
MIDSVSFRIEKETLDRCRHVADQMNMQAKQRFGQDQIGDSQRYLKGLLGEVYVRRWYLTALDRPLAFSLNSFLNTKLPVRPDGGFDIEIQGKRYDIKTQMSVTAPYSVKDFRCNVVDYQLRVATCYGYIWVCLHKSLVCGWLLGWLPKAEFMEHAVRHEAGTKCPSNGMKYKQVTHDISWEQIAPLRAIVAPPAVPLGRRGKYH